MSTFLIFTSIKLCQKELQSDSFDQCVMQSLNGCIFDFFLSIDENFKNLEACNIPLERSWKSIRSCCRFRLWFFWHSFLLVIAHTCWQVPLSAELIFTTLSYCLSFTTSSWLTWQHSLHLLNKCIKPQHFAAGTHHIPQSPKRGDSPSVIGGNRQLVTDEPVEFEK